MGRHSIIENSSSPSQIFLIDLFSGNHNLMIKRNTKERRHIVRYTHNQTNQIIQLIIMTLMFLVNLLIDRRNDFLIIIKLWLLPFVGPILKSNMKPPPPYLQKWPIYFICPKRCAIFWNVCKKKSDIFCIFSFNKIFILSLFLDNVF